MEPDWFVCSKQSLGWNAGYHRLLPQLSRITKLAGAVSSGWYGLLTGLSVE